MGIIDFGIFLASEARCRTQHRPRATSYYLIRGLQMKTIVGIAVAAALSIGAAHASITGPGTGQGELIEWVVDTTTNHVYARGIGVDETTILPAASIISDSNAYGALQAPVSTGTTLPTITADSALTTFLAQNGGHDSFSFGILAAGSATGGATKQVPGASVVEFTSPLSVAASNLNVPSGTSIASLVTSVGATVNTLNSTLQGANSGDVSGQFSPGSTEFALYSSNITLTSALGTDVNLYAITPNNSKPLAGQLYTAGLVTMTADGTLEEVGNTSPVPLPAAVWLLGSGLLGLAGVGRRRSV